MDRKIIDFVKNNKEVIEKGDFYTLYGNALINFVLPGYSNLVGDLTDLFESAGVNPLDYMSDVPSRYHFESRLPKNYKINDKINTISDWAFAYTLGIDTLDISNIKYIGEYAFYMSSIKTIEISGDVKEIQPHTFTHSDLINVVINEGTTTILNEAFSHCYELTDVWLPKSLTDLTASAFLMCQKLKDIYYSSTSYDFYNLNFNFNMIGSKKVDVHCTDKVITFYG